MPSSPTKWGDVKLGKGVRLLLGWRDDEGDLDATPVQLSSDAAEEFRRTCIAFLKGIGSYERRQYDGEAALDDEEYFAVPLAHEEEEDEADGEDTNDGDAQGGLLFPEETVAASTLVTLVREAFERDDALTRDELNGTWLFFVVVTEQSGASQPVGFVRQFNPNRGYSPGKFLTTYADKLKPVTDPVLNFDFSFDVVIGSGELAVFRTTGFERVFSDLNVAATKVPEHTDQIADAVGVGISQESILYLKAACGVRPRYAKRLRKIAQSKHLPKISSEAFKKALKRHGLPEDRFGSGKDLKISDPADIGPFLDLLEQRYYETDFTDEHKRADRSSARP